MHRQRQADRQMISLILATSLSLSFSIPSLFLCFKLVKRNFLGTVFNKSAAVIFGLSGEESSSIMKVGEAEGEGGSCAKY